MELYLVPNNPKNTVLVSPNGVAHFQTRTSKPRHGAHITALRRSADTEEDSIVAEIEWKRWETPTMIRSPMLGGLGRCVGKQGVGISSSDFIYKKHRFSSSYFFMGDDGIEYRWKMFKGVGFTLTQIESGDEIARYIMAVNREGLFAGEKKCVLQIQPCSVDIDLIVLSFLILEKKRRDKLEDTAKTVPHDEDPQGDGGSGDAGQGEL